MQAPINYFPPHSSPCDLMSLYFLMYFLLKLIIILAYQI